MPGEASTAWDCGVKLAIILAAIVLGMVTLVILVHSVLAEESAADADIERDNDYFLQPGKRVDKRGAGGR